MVAYQAWETEPSNLPPLRITHHVLRMKKGLGPPQTRVRRFCCRGCLRCWRGCLLPSSNSLVVQCPADCRAGYYTNLSTCRKSSSMGVSRPNIETRTLTL